MKKKILSLAVIALSMISVSAFAQNPNRGANNRGKEGAKKEMKCEKGEKCDKERKGDKCMIAFEGINLTDAQKAQIKTACEKRAAERKAAVDVQKQKRDNAKRDFKQKRDSVRKSERQAYLNDVKSILTPDQYVVFLENVYMNNAPQGKPQMAKQMRGNKAGKDFKQNKCEGCQQAQPDNTPRFSAKGKVSK